MTPEQEQILREVKQLAEENAETLRVIRRSYRIGNIMRVVYWVFLIGLSLVAMIFAGAGFLPPVTGAMLQEVIDVAVILNALRALR